MRYCRFYRAIVRLEDASRLKLATEERHLCAKNSNPFGIKADYGHLMDFCLMYLCVDQPLFV